MEWYTRYARSLPWRKPPVDPYAVWVSEIMLQQTRVETVVPYFLRWMERFPNLAALANADQTEVLSAWEGLGYYSRARSLHRAARTVVDQFHGQLPSGVNQLRELPGIGRYTAGAIASIAFGQDQAALDGNIRRVLSRVFDVGVPARSPQGERQLWELAWQNLPPGRAGDYNQAIMDLGATICLPKKPTCGACPLEEICLARALGVQEERPVVKPRPASPHYFVTAAVLERDGHVLIARRAENGLLGGLWEFPGGKLEDGETLPDCLSREIDEELGATVQVGDEIGVYRHAYTHFRVTLHAFFCRLAAGEPKANIHSAIAWVDPHRLEDYPMGKIDRKIAQDLIRGIDTPVP